MKTLELILDQKKVFFHELGGVYLDELEILIVSDLHFGKGISFAKNGFNIPPFDIDDTLSKLENIIKFFSPKKVITLGDNFHEKDSLKKIHKDSLFRINLLTEKYNFLWIIGNHDKYLKGQNLLYGKSYSFYKINRYEFRHIKTTLKKGHNFEFSGHYHPKCLLKYNGSSYNYKCFILGENFCILPSFGTYTGGLDVESEALKRVLKNKKIDLIVIGKRNILKKKLENDSPQR
jgi:DNA ligase-associated metallophosphoesterase